jgi:hypothetical protein
MTDENSEEKPRIGKNGNRLKVVKKGDPTPNPNGRPKGSRNRSTIVREWLEANLSRSNPLTGKREAMQVQDHMVLSIIQKALEQDVGAFKELMDSAYGKIADKVESKNKTDLNLDMSTDELNSILKKLDKL